MSNINNNDLINKYGIDNVIETEKGYVISNIDLGNDLSVEVFISKDILSTEKPVITTYYSGATGDHSLSNLMKDGILHTDDETNNYLSAANLANDEYPITHVMAALNSNDSIYSGIVVIPHRGTGFQGEDGYGFDIASKVIDFENNLKKEIVPNTTFNSVSHGWSASDQVSLIHCANDSDSNVLIYFDPKANNDKLRFPSFAAQHPDVISKMAGKKIVAFETTREVYNRQDLSYYDSLSYIDKCATTSGLTQNGDTLNCYKKAFIDEGVDVVIISTNSMHDLYTKVYSDGLFNYISGGTLDVKALYEDGLVKYKDFLHYSKYTRKWENMSEDLFNLYIKDDEISNYKYSLLTLKNLPKINPPENWSAATEAISMAINTIVDKANNLISQITSSKSINSQLELVNNSTIVTPSCEEELISIYQKNNITLLDVMAQDVYATAEIAYRNSNIDKELTKSQTM